MPWTQLVFEPQPGDLESLEAALHAGGALAVSLEDAGDQPVLEPAPGHTPLWPRVRVTALYAAVVDVDDILARVRDCCTSPPECRVAVLEDRCWEREWLRHARPLRFGTRLWVLPGAMSAAAGDAAVLRLDPGLAFGSGSHPSTALCLEWLALNEPAGLEVIDFGCGSGILAIAALKLGARRATAIDRDPQALAAAAANARRNGVTLELHDAPAVSMRCDVLLTNILADTLIERAASLAALVRPGGCAVLAGLLAGQEAAVAEAYRTWFDIGATACRDEWIRIDAVRRARCAAPTRPA